MDNYTTEVAATRVGAALPGARSAWASLSAVGAQHARTKNPVPAAGAVGARLAAFPEVQAPTMQLAAMADGPQTLNGTRKHNVHKTRINAGGYGAMGPHPEREPA